MAYDERRGEVQPESHHGGVEGREERELSEDGAANDAPQDSDEDGRSHCIEVWDSDDSGNDGDPCCDQSDSESSLSGDDIVLISGNVGWYI